MRFDVDWRCPFFRLGHFGAVVIHRKKVQAVLRIIKQPLTTIMINLLASSDASFAIPRSSQVRRSGTGEGRLTAGRSLLLNYTPFRSSLNRYGDIDYLDSPPSYQYEAYHQLYRVDCH